MFLASMSLVSCAIRSFDTVSGGPITGAMASCAGFIAAVAAVGDVATAAVGAASFDPEKSEEAVSQPPSPRAMQARN